jgi:hypothetical protein
VFTVKDGTSKATAAARNLEQLQKEVLGFQQHQLQLQGTLLQLLHTTELDQQRARQVIRRVRALLHVVAKSYFSQRTAILSTNSVKMEREVSNLP